MDTRAPPYHPPGRGTAFVALVCLPVAVVAAVLTAAGGNAPATNEGTPGGEAAPAAAAVVHPTVAFAPRLIELNTVRVIDADFADISDADYAEMTAEAERTLREKFGFTGLRFIDKGIVPAPAFFNKYLRRDDEWTRRITLARYDPSNGAPDFSPFRADVLRFLQRWKIEELQQFFPPSLRPQYADYDAILGGIQSGYAARIDILRELKSPKGRPLLNPKFMRERSFVNWLAAVRYQGDYDVILTNTFILFDQLTQPYLHSMFKHAKVGGVSAAAPKRTALDGRALMTSTFHMDTKEPFFHQDEPAEYTRDIRNKATGAFVLAHEIGHAAFRMPDMYDTAPGCLMGNAHDVDYHAGYEAIQAAPYICPQELPYLQARNLFFAADVALVEGRAQEALDLYKRVIAETPNPIDGARNEYNAIIAMRMVRCLVSMGNGDAAKRGVERALALDPQNVDAARWQSRALWTEAYRPGRDPLLAAAVRGLAERSDAPAAVPARP